MRRRSPSGRSALLAGVPRRDPRAEAAAVARGVGLVAKRRSRGSARLRRCARGASSAGRLVRTSSRCGAGGDDPCSPAGRLTPRAVGVERGDRDRLAGSQVELVRSGPRRASRGLLRGRRLVALEQLGRERGGGHAERGPAGLGASIQLVARCGDAVRPRRRGQAARSSLAGREHERRVRRASAPGWMCGNEATRGLGRTAMVIAAGDRPRRAPVDRLCASLRRLPPNASRGAGRRGQLWIVRRGSDAVHDAEAACGDPARGGRFPLSVGISL